MFKVTKDFGHQALTIFPVSMSMFLFGCAYGWVAPALAYFESEECPFPVSESELTWIASIFFLAELISPLIGGMFAGIIGRKWFIVFSTFMQSVAWFLIVTATSANAILVSRFLLGATGGIFDQVWSQYIGEITAPDKRGIFGSLMMSIGIGGIMFQFLLSMFAPYGVTVIVPLAMASLNLLFTFFVVESPLFLLMRNKDKAARKTLAWLRGEDDLKNVDAEFQEMKDYIHEQMKLRGLSVKEIFKTPPSEYKLSVVAILVFVLLNPSGNMIILTYQTLIFDLFKNSTNGNNLTVIYGITQFISGMLVPFLIEAVERRTLLIIGFAISAVIQITNTCLLYIAEHHDFDVLYIEDVLLVLFNIYGIAFMLCICSTAYVLKSELFPQKLKTVGSVISTFTNSLAAFLVLKPFMYISDMWGMHVNFAICSIFCIFGVIYSYVLVPKTKGKSLAEIQRESEKKIDSEKL